MKVYHHNDHDGRCAAFLLRFYLESKGQSLDKNDFIESDYNTIINLDQISEGEDVYFLDFHPKIKDDYLWLRKNTNLTIFDHHRSAIRNIHQWESEIDSSKYRLARLVLDESRSGCLITYDELLKDTILNKPYFVTLINDYDTWKHSHPETYPFFYGLQMHDTSPFSDVWDSLMANYGVIKLIKMIIDSGRMIVNYQEKYDRSELQSIGFETMFEGYKCLCINRWRSSSHTFEITPNYDMYISFYFNGSKWTVSLYSLSKKVDVSIIAEKYGGGGHPGSAGFQCKTLPFVN